jgi:hypothetical protein
VVHKNPRALQAQPAKITSLLILLAHELPYLDPI